MSDERLRYIVEKLGEFDKTISWLAYIESLEDKSQLVDVVKQSPFWDESKPIVSIVRFIENYIEEYNIDNAYRRTLSGKYNSFATDENSASMYEFAYGKSLEDSKKR